MTKESDISLRSELRRKGLASRDAIPEALRDAYSQIIRKKTIEYLDSINARFVHTYIGFRSEVGTHGIIEDLFERNITVVVPFTTGTSQSEHMSHSLLRDLTHLRPGKFGVPEPQDKQEREIAGIDAVIIPIVCFDGTGMRLGYGKGFYDRFLHKLPPEVKRIGLAFSIQEMDNIPMESHDELIKIIFTEQSHFILK